MKYLTWTSVECNNEVMYSARLCQYLINSSSELTTIYSDLNCMEIDLDSINKADNIPMILLEGVRHDIKELNYDAKSITEEDIMDIVNEATSKLELLKQLLILRQML